MKPKATTKVPCKRRSLRNWTVAAFLLPLFTMTGVLRAQVTNIIYQDNFARVGPLDGSAPDTVNVPGATWIACNVPGLNAQVQTDGSEIALTNVPGATNGLYLNGFLPFVPQVGHIYTLSCQISALSGGTNFLAMGFAVQPLTNTFFYSVKCGAGLNLVRGNGTGVQSYRFPGGSGSPALKAAAYGTTTNLFTVILDTTTGTGAARGWTYKFFTNGVQVDSFATANVNPTMIQYVGIGADATAQGDFQQFTLTDALIFTNRTMAIVEQPPNRTAQVGQTATFWVEVTNDYPSAAYQWMTNNGVGGPTNAVPGATNGFYTTPTLDMSYNGLNYSVTVTNTNGSTNSVAAVLTVVSGPPTVFSVTKTTSVTNIVVAFSKAVDPVTGLNPANYSLIPAGVSIVSASYGSASNNVILKTSTLNTNTGYALKVQNVQDSFGNAMTASTNAVLPAGLVLFMRGDSGVVFDASNNVVQWLDQTTNGNNASQFFGVPSVGLVGSASRPGTNIINNGQPSLDFGNLGSGVNLLHWLQAPNSPSLASMISNTTMYAVADFYSTAGNDFINKTWGNLPAPFDWDPSTGENVQYGNGFNNAPAGGIGATIVTNTPYVLSSFLQFPTAPGGTTNFQFYLNGAVNGNGTIRGVTGNPSGIYDGGQPVWIGGRMDLQAANPKMRGQIAEIMLFNTALSDADRAIVDNYLGIKYFTFAIITDLPPNTTTSNGFAVTYTFAAGAGSAHGFSFQWQENGTNIPGATGSTYTTPALAPGDNGDKFDVQVTLPNGSFVYSTTNTLTVLNVAPFITWAGIPIWNTTNQIIVTFDEAVDPVTATAATNYSLNNGVSVLSAATGNAPNQVVLTTTPITWNANPGFYTLNVQNVMDLFGNTMTPAAPSVGLYPANTALWIRANTGVVIDVGTNTVNFWNDLSGNSNNFSSSGSIEPQLVTNAWGDPVIRFNVTDSVTNYMFALSSSTLAITGDMSVFAVVNFMLPGNGTHGEIVSKTGTGATRNIPAPYDYYVGGAPALYRGNGNGTANGINYGQFTGTQGPSASYPTVVAVSETGNTVSHYLDGQSAGTGVLNGGFAETNDFDQGNVVWIGERSDFVNRLAGDLFPN